MKKLLTILLAFALTGIVTAEDFHERISKITDIPLHKEHQHIDLEQFGGKNSRLQQYRGDSLYYIGNNQLVHYATGTSPVSYDPATNLLSVAMIYFDFSPTTGGLTGTNLFTLNTTDNGQNWDSSFVYRDPADEVAPMYPSLALTNSANSGNREDVNYVFYGTVNYRDNGGGLVQDAGGGVFVYYSPDFGGIFPSTAMSPDLGGNANDPQEWNRLRLKSEPSDDLVYGSGTLSPTSDASQYGFYGYWGFDFGTQSNVSNNPEEWWTKHFRQVDTKTSSFNGPIQVGKDQNGNLYGVLNNIFADDEDTRLLAFSKSSDNGENWTDFEKMPRTVLTDFVAEYSGYTSFSTPSGTAYQPSQLFIRGENDFSFFTRILIFNPDDEELPLRYFIVDMRHNNGTWSIDVVDELETYGPTVFNEHSSTQGNNDPNNEEYDLEIQNAQSFLFGNNLQMSRTADGSKIVLYWIDGDPGNFVKFEPYNIYSTTVNQLTGEQEEVFEPIDSLQVFDIYCKVYNVDTDEWEETKNMTADDHNDFLFHVPDVIKSVDEAQILTYDVVKVTNPQFPLFGVPEPINELMWGLPPYMKQATFDARNPRAGISSVENTLAFDVELKDAYPNPVVNSEIVEIGFTLEQAAQVSLDLYNSVGNKVMNIINNQYLQTSFKNVNIGELNSGTYYYQLTVDGHRFTKKLVVIK
jgi:hypothetical protein